MYENFVFRLERVYVKYRRCTICKGLGRLADDGDDDFGYQECPRCYGDGRLCLDCGRPESKCVCDENDENDDDLDFDEDDDDDD